eukprot:122222_1
MSFVETYQWFWIDAVICTLTFIILTGLFILQLLVSLQNTNIISFCNCFPFDSSNKKPKYTSVATSATLFALFFYFIYGTDVFLSRIDSLFGEYFHKNLSITCDVFVRIGTISYQLSKGCIYCVFVLRLKLAFDGSMYEYSNKVIKSLLLIIIVYSLINAINGFFFVYGNKTYIHTPHSINKAFYTCQTEIHIYVLIYMVLFDISFTGICMFMFIKPLRKIINHNVSVTNIKPKIPIDNLPNSPELQSNVSTAHIGVTKEFKFIIVKYTIISCVALLSTFCALVIIGVTDSPAFSMIDVWINAICLVLMCQQYEKYYKIFCCCLINVVHSKKTVTKSMRMVRVNSRLRTRTMSNTNMKHIEKEIQKDIDNHVSNKNKVIPITPDTPNPKKIVKNISLTPERSASLIEDYNENNQDIELQMH